MNEINDKIKVGEYIKLKPLTQFISTEYFSEFFMNERGIMEFLRKVSKFQNKPLKVIEIFRDDNVTVENFGGVGFPRVYYERIPRTFKYCKICGCWIDNEIDLKEKELENLKFEFTKLSLRIFELEKNVILKKIK